jgi:hypothetical protein
LISHKYKIIFIHIPKCAGSSIEYYFDIAPFKWKQTNRLHLTGWDKQLKIHLQHAPSKTLLDNKLISEECWNSYFKFAFVRNPWDKAFSDYYWMMKDRKVEGTFEEYLSASGPFAVSLNDSKQMHYRGDHLKPQHEFIYDNDGNLLVDFVGRFENLEEDFKMICQSANIKYSGLPHVKKSIEKKIDYHQFYDETKMKLVADKYEKDIELFDYKFRNE